MILVPGLARSRTLRDLELDTLKLDRHLIARLPDSARDASLVQYGDRICANNTVCW
jgi:EAL domain-containing protein (putative c-di-GMP-specific phosphodiesterase class I)